MPKYRKGRKRVAEKQALKQGVAAEQRFMFSSSLKAYVLAGIFLAVSLLLNTELISLVTADTGKFTKALAYALRGGVVVAFFFFAWLAWGNLKEVRGRIFGLKEMIFLIVISLLQTLLNGYVFLVALVGVVLVCVYMWVMQIKIQT